jgi:magnesium transporter
MICSIYYAPDGTTKFDLTLEEIGEVRQKSEGLLWVSLEEPTNEEIHSVLVDRFQFHPLAVEDCLSLNYQPPKVDDFNDYLFVIVHALRPDCAIDQLSKDFATIEFNAFLSQNYLITVFRAPTMPAVQTVWERLKRHHRLLERGTDILYYAILDYMVDEYLPFLDAIDGEIDQLEDNIFARPVPSLLQRVLVLKHSIITLRRILTPQREVMNRLSRDEFPQIAPEHRIYYRDLYDHLVRLQDLSEGTRDTIGGALEAYLSVTSNRMNEIMKTLAIISTIFLPLSFVAGVYGMNFEVMPILEWPYGYYYIWGVFIVMAAGMMWYFKRRGWF